LDSDAAFRGVIPYLISPIDPATGRVLEEPLRELVDHLIGHGVHGLSPLGSTGEVAYLSLEQRVEIVRVVTDQAGGRVPVIPGVAACSTAQALRQAELFTGLGVDGLVLILETYFPLQQEQMASFFETVARQVDCPIVLYSNPILLGSELTVDTIVELSRIENIRYWKDASGVTGKVLSVIGRTGGRLAVFSASAHVPLLVLMLGGVGWMSGPACIAPRQAVRLYDLWLSGDFSGALSLQRALWELNELFSVTNMAACVKHALTIQGFAVGAPLPPQPELPARARSELAAIIERLSSTDSCSASLL
jgi:4-hydroxy-tetrahydrodipicolinate synthase